MVFVRVLTTSVVVALLWVVTRSIRRLFFHRLSHIPGPRLAALTWWYEFHYNVVLPGKYIFKIQELHREYGPILRITPEEVHINDVGFLDTVYAGLRDKYEYPLKALRVPGGVGATADAKLHKLRREALVPFFSKRNVLSLQHLIAEKVDQLSEIIAKHAIEASQINLSDLFFAFSNDQLGMMVKAGEVRPKKKPSTESLPPQERTLTRLEQEGALLALAGTESPALSLGIIFYHLLANPSILNRLRTEIETVPTHASWPQLEKLPYLMAVIEEGNRLSFGVTARIGRRAHEELVFTPSSYATTPGTGVSYKIPARTPLSISTLSAHTAQSVFPDPFTIDPERWLGEAGRKRKRFQMAFTKGSRNCLGIELANAELCLVIAALVRSFEMTLLDTDARDVSFEHDYQIAMPNIGSKGVRVTVI
ncbi:Cytochrome P450 [Penicillium frequentans]|uniref:Cytochrome P450 n=1 Tax=Penicillium frequentans TaxID=3151616 RepID=A0AAD6D081_9EURO|nr:Cytochrome P450 [Penicillium glabrum]